MVKCGFLIDDRYRSHDPGNLHPESPERLVSIQQALDASGVATAWRRIEPRPAQVEEIGLIHSPGHIVRVRRSSAHAPAYLDADTPVCAASYDIALLAAGGVLECCDAICGGDIRRAFAFIRPPGHHAEPDRAMGFCLFNNIAVGAAYLKRHHKLERVAIVDFDVHHGNGTQAAFYQDAGVLFISTHQFPFYPGTGAFEEVGAGEGWGYTLNFPLPAGAGDGVFIPIYSRIVPAILARYQPQFILVSAGFDAVQGDPLGGLRISPSGIASAAASLCNAADAFCDGRICFVLEGGYSPSGLKECTRGVLSEMASDDPKELMTQGDTLFDIISQQAANEFGEHWRW